MKELIQSIINDMTFDNGYREAEIVIEHMIFGRYKGGSFRISFLKPRYGNDDELPKDHIEVHMCSHGCRDKYTCLITKQDASKPMFVADLIKNLFYR